MSCENSKSCQETRQRNINFKGGEWGLSVTRQETKIFKTEKVLQCIYFSTP